VRDRIREAPVAAVTTADLAHDSGFHPVYVARAFRDYYGIGVGEFARLVRADRASEMLRASAEPLARIAAHAGYADQSHLSRDMRRLLGHTPATLRRRRAGVLQVSSVQDPGRDPA
jgi:AraC family transcriptional regulator